MEVIHIEELARTIGYKRVFFSWECSIRADGSTRDLIRVRVRSFIETLRNIHFRVDNEPNASPTIKFRELSQSGEFKATGSTNGLDRRGNYSVFFDPYLPFAGEAEFEIQLDYPAPTLFMLADDLKAFRRDHPDPIGGSNYEYIYHFVGIPTDLLELRVVFPKRFKGAASVQCRAFRDAQGTAHPRESERILATFKSEPETMMSGPACAASVKKPIFGIGYAILWELQ